MQIGEVIGLNRNFVPPEAPVANAAAAMVGARCTFLPILNGNLPVGVVTRRDLLVRSRGLNVRRTPVSRIMSASPTCVSETADPSEVARMMVATCFRHIVVVASDGSMVGVATADCVRPFVADREVSNALMSLACTGDMSPPPCFLNGNFLG